MSSIYARQLSRKCGVVGEPLDIGDGVLVCHNDNAHNFDTAVTRHSLILSSQGELDIGDTSCRSRTLLGNSFLGIL